MPEQQLFSFTGTVHGRESSVLMTDDGLLHAVDLVMVVTGKDRDQSGNVLRRLTHEIFPRDKFTDRPSIRGGHPIKFITFQNAIELIMILPGKTAKNIRKQFADVIVRYLDGDRSMCSEIKANKTMGKAKSYSKFASNNMKNVEQDCAKKTLEIPQTIYMYATKSSAFPGLVKIGRTENLKQRLTQLNTGCAPAPHIIVAMAPTFDNVKDEKIAHEFFSDVRREGEFFELCDEEVVKYFSTHITAKYNSELSQKISEMQGMCI